MPFPFTILLLGLPFLELYIMIKVGGEYGALPVLAWIVASILLGVHIIRAAGWLSASKIQESMLRGDMPFAAMFQAAGMVFAGFLLIIPGFITDALGLLLLIGPVRSGVGALITKNASFHTVGGGAARHANGDTVIDGEFTVVDEPQGQSAGEQGSYDQISHTVIDMTADEPSDSDQDGKKTS